LKILFVGLGSITLLTLLAVQVAAVFDVNIFDHAPWLVVTLILGILVPFVGFITHLRGDLDLGEKPAGGWTWSHTRVSLARLVRLFPVWGRWVIAACYVHAGILFASLSLGEPGQAAIRDGRYVLESKGRVVRELGHAEYEHLHARLALVFCGFITVFCVVPLLYFLAGGPEGRERQPVLRMKHRD
jgi:hypothetical protein